jgi:dGTP triphosphohydrolase
MNTVRFIHYTDVKGYNDMKVLFSGECSANKKELKKIARECIFNYTETAKIKIVKHASIKGIFQLLYTDAKHCAPFDKIFITIS